MSNQSLEYPTGDLEAMGVGRNYVRWIHSYFASYVRGSVAEVGAGIGIYSKVLLETPTLDKLCVFEPSKNLVGMLERAVEGAVKSVECHNTYFKADNRYDTVVYINVMEHIEDDVAEMKKVYQSLHNEGRLLVFVPALPFLYSENDRKVGHYRRYTKKELVTKIEQSGFSIVRWRYFDSLGVLSWLICCKLMKMMPAAGSVGLYDRLFVPILRRLEACISPLIGKNLLVVAQKL